MVNRTLIRRLEAFALAGVVSVLTIFSTAASAAEYRFVARDPSSSQPIWESEAAIIDASEEEILLVLDNPTDKAHGFTMPQHQLVARERIIRSVDSLAPLDQVLQYTEQLSVTVDPGTVRRILLSDGRFRSRQSYSESAVFFCPLHKGSRAGSVSFVK
jgi:hypothetical protein